MRVVSLDHIVLLSDDIERALAWWLRRLWGAHGTGVGLYVRDPDGNVVELRTYAEVSAVSPARTS